MSHSSHPTNPPLGELRQELEQLNTKLFDLMAARRTVVAQIQAAKPASRAEWSSFDAARERTLFAQLAPQLGGLSLKELCAFSLLMESHASAPERYPAWSEGVHLLELPLKEHQRLNPLLLKQLHPELFGALKLRPSFAFLRDS